MGAKMLLTGPQEGDGGYHRGATVTDVRHENTPSKANKDWLETNGSHIAVRVHRHVPKFTSDVDSRLAQRAFDCDKTGLFWTARHKPSSAPTHEQCNVQMSVTRRLKSEARVTCDLFSERLNQYFKGPKQIKWLPTISFRKIEIESKV